MTENFEIETTKTLAEHGQTLAEYGRILADHGKKLDKHQVILENPVAKVLQHDDEFEKVCQQIKESENRILEAIDNFVKKTDDVEIEQTSTIAILGRYQDEIDSNKKQIIKIKKVVKIA